MAKFMPVAPIHILEQLQSRGNSYLGADHLMLAHHTVEYSERFSDLVAKYYNGFHGRPPDIPMTIIMDNSVVELGEAQVDEMVNASCEAVRPNHNGHRVIPVLPDVMGDGPATRDASHEAYHRWTKQGMTNQGGFMVVAHGYDWKDFCTTIDHFFIEYADEFPQITWLGIPRKLVETLGTRDQALNYVSAVVPSNIKVHLLGFSDNVVDDVSCCQWNHVNSIDSAVPLRYDGLFTPTKDAGKRGNWFEEARLTPQLVQNLGNAKRWCDNNPSYLQDHAYTPNVNVAPGLNIWSNSR